jgi:hypothetical protein
MHIMHYVKDGKLTMDDFHGHDTNYIGFDTTNSIKHSKSESVVAPSKPPTPSPPSPQDFY